MAEEISEAQIEGWKERKKQEEEESIAVFGPPLRCPKCGHDIFSRDSCSSEEVKLLHDDGEIVPHVVSAEYTDNPMSAECVKCGEYYEDMYDLIPEEESESA